MRRVGHYSVWVRAPRPVQGGGAGLAKAGKLANYRQGLRWSRSWRLLPSRGLDRFGSPQRVTCGYKHVCHEAEVRIKKGRTAEYREDALMKSMTSERLTQLTRTKGVVGLKACLVFGDHIGCVMVERAGVARKRRERRLRCFFFGATSTWQSM